MAERFPGRCRSAGALLRLLPGAVAAVFACAVAQAQTSAAPASPAAASAASAASAAEAASGEADTLAAAGAPQLALEVVDSAQSGLAAGSPAWSVWERTRIGVLTGAGDEQALFRRIDALPADAPFALVAFALDAGAKAALSARDPVRARAYLRRLIWTDPPPPPAALADYRRLVVRSYVVGGELADAARALAYLDRGGRAGDWRTRELAAEVALERGEPGTAVHELSALKRDEVRPLLLLAQLEAGAQPPAAVAAAARRLAAAAEAKHDRRLAGRAQFVAARAAARTSDLEAQLAALLAALRLDPGDSGPFALDAQLVWQALIDGGLALGNAHRLLLGDVGPWLAAAKAERAAGRPTRSLALLAAAGLAAPASGSSARALDAFAAQLAARRHGDALLLALFGDRRRFPQPTAIPGAVRYRLVDPAVAAGRVDFASALLAGLGKPPPGVSPGDWQLERARLFLLGGDAQRAAALLTQLARGDPQVPGDKLLPVVLDLETLGRNQDALGILQTMLAAHPAPALARHLLYWIGKAYDGLGAPLDAARAYLESAVFDSPYAMDPWAKTSRYSAAEALTRAGLYGDARRIYEGLLNASSDPAEQALLKQRLAAVNTLATRAQGATGEH